MLLEGIFEHNDLFELAAFDAVLDSGFGAEDNVIPVTFNQQTSLFGVVLICDLTVGDPDNKVPDGGGFVLPHREGVILPRRIPQRVEHGNSVFSGRQIVHSEILSCVSTGSDGDGESERLAVDENLHTDRTHVEYDIAAAADKVEVFGVDTAGNNVDFCLCGVVSFANQFQGVRSRFQSFHSTGSDTALDLIDKNFSSFGI